MSRVPAATRAHNLSPGLGLRPNWYTTIFAVPARAAAGVCALHRRALVPICA